MSAYCDLADVFAWIPAEAVQHRARLVASVATTTNTLTLDGHGLVNDSPVMFRAEAGGSLPSPLVAGTTYYAIRLGASTFQVAGSVGGAAIDLTTIGENVVAVIEPPWSEWIEAASNELECTMPAHAVPLAGPYPAIVRSFCAGIVAEKALGWAGVSSTGLDGRMGGVRKELEKWRSQGIPIRGAIIPPSTNLSVRGAATSTDSRGWASRGDRFIP